MALPLSTDVFVIGGGPAGLAAAVAARRRGFDVTLADCSIPPIDKACGEGVMPDGIAAAAALGIDLTAAGGRPFRGIRFCDSDVVVEACFPAGVGLGLRRTALHRLMTDRALGEGVHMLWGPRVTGLCRAGVVVDGQPVAARWIVGADGGQSSVRRWARLDAFVRDSRRYGFRRHFRLAPWSEHMELHWSKGCQLYITAVGEEEICVVALSRDPHLRLEAALARFPVVARRLAGAGLATLERGGLSASRRLRAVTRDNVALVGDASGSVDAITGEGLCLLFQHAAAVAEAMAAGDLGLYEAAHRRLGRRPALMEDLMLLLDGSHRIRRRAIRAMASRPVLFTRMLATHVGHLSPLASLSNGLALGWQMLAP
jgi:flavin-dependent dehydrogenase